MKSIIVKLLYRLYSIDKSIVRKFIIWCLRKIENENYSSTLRNIFLSYHNIKIGMYSYGGCFSLGHIPVGTEIGRYCSFAKNIYIFSGNHPIKNKSTHPFFYNPACGFVNKYLVNSTKLKIGNDVWIAHNVIILPSVSYIGDGAVIGAGSVVTKDIPPFAVVAGNPAKVVNYRFSEEKIKQLMESAWWNKNIDELRDDIDTFLEPLEW